MSANKKVVLINPVFQFEKHLVERSLRRRSKPRMYPPLGLLQIGGHLKRNGFEVILLDVPQETNPFGAIDRIAREGDLLAVGITVKTGPPLLFAMQASYYIKRNFPDVAVVWGGVLPTTMPKEVLHQTFADYVVVGQGEESMLAICQSLLEGRMDIASPGVCYLKDGLFCYSQQEPFSKHYPVDWSILLEDINEEQSPYLAALMLSKGCPFRCSFCYHQNSQDLLAPQAKRWFPKPEWAVFQELDYLKAKGVRVVTFIDDCTLLNKKRVDVLAKGLVDRAMYIEQCISHVKTLDTDVIEKVAPFTQQIAYSIETVSPRLQHILNKTISTERVEEVDRALARNNINSIHNFIFGIPTETDDDLRLNIDLAIRLRKINPYLRLTGIFCIPYPCSSLEGWLKQHMGLSITKDLRVLSTADMYTKTISPVFQPWITDPDEKQFYEDFYYLFDAFFAGWFNNSDSKVKTLMQSKRLSLLFEPALGLEPPPNKPPYILDALLKNPDIPYPNGKIDFLHKV